MHRTTSEEFGLLRPLQNRYLVRQEILLTARHPGLCYRSQGTQSQRCSVEEQLVGVYDEETISDTIQNKGEHNRSP